MALLHVDSSAPPAGADSKEFAATAREAWQKIAWRGRPQGATQTGYLGQAPADASRRRHTPAHRAGRMSRGRHAPGLHRRPHDSGKAVTQLFKAVRFPAW